MPKTKRTARTPTHDWDEIRQLGLFPEQRRYERFRPSELFGQAVTERATQTGAPVRTLRHDLAQFETMGMMSLFRPLRRVDPQHSLPTPMRQLIVDLKREHPPLRAHEIATICYVTGLPSS